MSPHERRYTREKMRARRARFKAAGTCIDCGKVPPPEGRSRCDACRDKSHGRYQRATEYRLDYARTRYQQRRARGICAYCPAESPRYYACRACRLKRSAKPFAQCIGDGPTLNHLPPQAAAVSGDSPASCAS
jgi:hypothetical protein